ncbi:MAG: T9SS type A sorting domain-containing protein [Flavobacteriales bacterium]|nr:T9SS type A sorting domain-containing protein [Flavobacteriales bacterium]
MRQIIFILLLFICSNIGFSQKDTLVDLFVNKKLHSKSQLELLNQRNIFSQKKKLTLTLPFFDDFSQEYYLPDDAKWQDVNVFINSNYPVNPISYGVATFDGLDSTGYPYDFLNPTSHGIADYLTSQTIDLTTITDSVYLSFYFQPKGNGNRPENKDSLRLEFFRKSDSTWVRQWATPGMDLTPFQLVMIPVDTSYQNDAFQFRFKNYATLSGNVDHWHLDYVYLNDNRTYTDTTLDDVSFVTNNYNMLYELTSMPWSHYMVDSIANMRQTIDVEYRNNHNANYAVFYKYQVIENNGAGPVIETYPSTTSSKNVTAFSSLIEPQAVYQLPLNNFYFPTDDTATTKVFQIKNYFDLNSIIDFNQKNDTVNSYQVFGNHYSYDDGSAEAGYGVEGIDSKLANQFYIKKSDTLKSIRIYFNPVTYNHSDKSFKLCVWSSLNPEVKVYEQTAYYNPQYSLMNEFLEYDLEYPLFLNAGLYYFGYQNITQDFLTLGYDFNNNTSNRIYFNAEGVWENSNYPGSLMLQPAFMNSEPVVGIDEESKNLSSAVFPNPSNGIFHFNVQKPIEISVFDMLGNVVKQFSYDTYSSIDLSYLPNGVFFLKIADKEGSAIQKIIISKQ